METIRLSYPASVRITGRSCVGVVGSGDLEVLMEPSPDDCAIFVVRTNVQGFGQAWRHVIERFANKRQAAVAVTINDAGATPGVVAMRLEQAWEGVHPC